MGRTWVAIGGALLCLVFVLLQLTGSEVDRQAGQIGSTAATVVGFSVFGLAGVALAYWQPRLAWLGAATATMALLAGGATVVVTWSDNPLLFSLAVGHTSATVIAIADLLTVAGAVGCILLATIRPGEDGGTRLVRLGAIGSLVLLVALLILVLVVDSIEIGARVWGVLAAVFAFAFLTSLVLRLLPLDETLEPR